MRRRLLKRPWNFARKHALGERFLRMAGAADIAAAQALWKNAGAPVDRRCLAARAIGLLGKLDQNWEVEGLDEVEGLHDDALDQARRRGTSDARELRLAQDRAQRFDQATEKMRQMYASSISNVIGILQDRSKTTEQRVEAATILRDLNCRDAVEVLVEALGEGQPDLSWMCMSALTTIGSRRGTRRLIQIAGGNAPLSARQQAVYTL